jgi:hypothetical protein
MKSKAIWCPYHSGSVGKLELWHNLSSMATSVPCQMTAANSYLFLLHEFGRICAIKWLYNEVGEEMLDVVTVDNQLSLSVRVYAVIEVSLELSFS